MANVEIYGSARPDEYEVRIHDDVVGYATLENGAWTAYPRGGGPGVAGFATPYAAAQEVAAMAGAR